MTVDALIARMTQDARARIAAARAEADGEVAALLAAGTAAVARGREQTLAVRQARRRAVLDAERAAAQRQATTRVLSAQHAFLDRVFARAESLAVEAVSDKRYLDALPEQVAALASYLGGQPATLRCRPELAPHLRPLLARLPRVELAADAMLPAGFVVDTADGSCTIDCTLPTRLAALRPRLEAGLLARVPGERAGPSQMPVLPPDGAAADGTGSP